MNKTLLIDGDGCPVVDIAIKVAKEFGIKPLIFCDTAHVFQCDGVETLTVSKGMDAVDFALINRLHSGDIVVTQDYGLAAMVLAKNGYAINQNGMVYTNENIDKLLFTRYVSKKIRNSGGRLKGPKKRTKEDNLIFKEKLIELCKTVVALS
ncbi:MAG: YaiI/YqxD family protein [Bacillaceae bacterium]